MKKFLPIGLIFLFLILLGGILIFQKENSEKISQRGGEIVNSKFKMQNPELEKRVLFIVALQNFRDEEYQKPRQVL